MRDTSYNAVLDKIRALPVGPDGWIKVDLPKISREVGVSSGSSALAPLVKAGIIQLRKPSPQARRISAVRFVQQESGTSAKDIVLRLLNASVDKRGRVRLDTHTIARRAGLSDHDLAKILFDLRGEGAISFRKSGSDAAMRIRNIRMLTGVPMAEPDESVAEEEPVKPEPVKPKPATNGAAVSHDMLQTYRRNHYPLIMQLSERQANIEEAARRLEAAGLLDESIALLEKVDSLSPLEREIVALVDQLGWGK